MAIIFVVALYGGYFGAGIGILMSFISPGDIQHVVALKNLLTGCLRGMAVIVLIIDGNVDWKYGVPMALGGLAGGYIGGLVVASRKPRRRPLDRYCNRVWSCGLLLLEAIWASGRAPRRRLNQRSGVGDHQRDDSDRKRFDPRPAIRS